MKSIFKATAILGSSSIVTVITGLISAKFLAKMIGPTGIGYLAMMQGFLALAVMISGLGVATGTVKTVAKAIAEKDEEAITSNQKAAITLTIVSGFTALLLIILFQDFFNRLMLDGQGNRYEIVLLGVGSVFMLAAACFTGILNAHHNIKALAQIAIVNSILNVAFLIFFAWLFGIKGLIYGIISGTIFNFILSFFLYKRTVKSIKIEIPFDKLLIKIKSLLKFGVPFTASSLVGSGVQLLLPLLILHNLDLENVGFYRAASVISVTSLSFILAAMGQDYYPRLSKISTNNDLLIATVNEQLHFALIIFSPMLLWLLLLSPQVVLFLYSAQFSKTSDILSLMLIGDIFKLFGWMLGFVLLARSRSGIYFFSELTFGIILLSASYFGIQYFGVIGAGIGYMIGYFCYFLAVWYFAKREIGVTFTIINKILMLYILSSAILVFVLLNFFTGNVNIYIAAGFCLITSILSIIYFVNQFRGEKIAGGEKF